MTQDTYKKLLDFLDKGKAHYRLIDHPPEGRTDIVSPMRGNELSQAAKCIVIMVKITKKQKKYVLGVVPGDVRIDLNAIKALFDAKYVSFADQEIAEELAGSVAGTVLPFAFHPDLELIVDPSLLDNEELFFNAARLDRSMALKTSDYKRLAEARFENIAEGSVPQEGEEHDMLYKKRHSLAHILAQAVLDMFPEAKLGIGPPIDNGFYYDFDLPRTLIPEDLSLLEKKMKKIIAEDQKFEGKEEPVDQSIQFLKELKQKYKVELAEGFKADGETQIGFWKNGPFIDMCRGGHVVSTKQIDPKSFKLTSIAGAYWKGDEKNKMLQRIYGWAFETPSELQKYEAMMEEARKRDHRKIGKELDLFTFSELVGKGLPLFTPKGAMLREILNDFSVELRLKKGFERVWIPHITKNDLYKTSGHWDKFGDELFLVKSQETSDELVMKPMNCPHHQQIFASKPRSYKDLPIRYLETTTIYRDERAGELLGLSRVRSITQDDSHTFCTPDQIEDVYQDLIDVTKTFYEKVGMPLKVRLSYRDPDQPEKYLGEPELWDKAQEILLKIAKKSKLDYYEAEGEAAFYGPKMDFMGVDALGREWQLATPQLDFVQPERFGLKYVDEDGTEKTPVMIHFALMGSIERFLSVYIEHTAGFFPIWLAPVQVRILPVSQKFEKYALEVAAKLKKVGGRVEVDMNNDTLGKKVRNAELMKIPHIVVVGEKEEDEQEKKVTVRSYDTKKQKVYSLAEYVKELKKLSKLPV